MRCGRCGRLAKAGASSATRSRTASNPLLFSFVGGGARSLALVDSAEGRVLLSIRVMASVWCECAHRGIR